jgi:hypothetical protein
MKHTAHMNNRDLICCGHRVHDRNMTDADRSWAMQSKSIQKDNHGQWFHTLITDRDRKSRQDFWNPDTGPWRKGVNY